MLPVNVSELAINTSIMIIENEIAKYVTCKKKSNILTYDVNMKIVKISSLTLTALRIPFIRDR